MKQAVVGAVLVATVLGIGPASSASTTGSTRTIGTTGPDGATSGPAATRATGDTATYIVRFRPGVDARATASRRTSRLGRVDTVLTNVFPGVITTLTGTQAAALADDPDVIDVERDGVVWADETQADPVWGLDRIDQRRQPLDESYGYPGAAGNGVDAYIIDTGVRADHTELAGRVKPGATAFADGRGTTDCQGHGTHVAATVAGTTYGVAKRASIIPVRVLDCNGSGTDSTILAGMDWVVGHHTSGQRAVANISIGGGTSSQIDAGVAEMTADGIVVAVSAGNDGTDACTQSPARAPSAITVGATAWDDRRAAFSNSGRCIDVFAPGQSITSAGISSTTATSTKSGTSMASPHVAGAAAVLWSQDAGLTSATVATRLVVTNSTTGLVTDAGPSSPNRLLYSPPVAGPPANDDLANATPVDIATAGQSVGTVVSATVQPGEPAHSGVAATRSVWWTFTATATGPVTLTASSGTVNLAMAVYTGSSLGGLTKVGDTGRTGFSATYALEAVGGTTYRVALDAWNGEVGPVTLAWTGVGRSAASPWWPLTTPAKLVDRHFRDLLGRAPTSDEMAQWTTRLMNGSATGSSLAIMLRSSADNTSVVDPTVRLYRSVLRRTPDQAGLAYWLTQRRTGGWSLNRMADFFVRSKEFVDRYGSQSNRAFVAMIYDDVLERPGDAAGIDFWTGQLDTRKRSRGQVLLGFTESPEYKGTYAHHVDATVAYTSLLKRPPTAEELASWVTRRTAGTTHAALIQEIMEGDAYTARGI